MQVHKIEKSFEIEIIISLKHDEAKVCVLGFLKHELNKLLL